MEVYYGTTQSEKIILDEVDFNKREYRYPHNCFCYSYSINISITQR